MIPVIVHDDDDEFKCDSECIGGCRGVLSSLPTWLSVSGQGLQHPQRQIFFDTHTKHICVTSKLGNLLWFPNGGLSHTFSGVRNI